MDYRALPVFTRRGRLVAAGHQPHRARQGSDARQHHRGRRQPVRRARREAASRRRLSGKGADVRHQRIDLRDQRSPLALALQRRSVDHRQADLAQRHAVHRRRRDGAEVPFPRRRRRLAARALGLHAAQPRRAFHGSGRAALAGHDVRAGAKRGRRARHPARAGEPAHQQGLELAAGAAARRRARLLPAGVDGAVRRGRVAARHRRAERRHAAADAGVVARKGNRRSRRPRRRAPAAGDAVDGRKLRALGRRRRCRHRRNALRRCRSSSVSRRSRFRGSKKPASTFARSACASASSA